MEKEWITTSELLAFLKSHPDDEFTCQLYLGYRLYSLLVLICRYGFTIVIGSMLHVLLLVVVTPSSC